MVKNKIGTKALIFLCVLLLIVGVVLGSVGFYFYKTQIEIQQIKVYTASEIINNGDTYSEDNDNPHEDDNNGSHLVDDNTDFNLGDNDNPHEDVYVSGNIYFHFLELGNEHTGDCTYIKAGDVDILIDAGSKVNSIPTITTYINQFIEDNTIEYVIVTHAHEDHYAGFATNENTSSIFDLYNIGTIIDFAQTNQSSTAIMYNNYLREREEAVSRGAKHYTALDCVNATNGATDEFTIYDDITMKILNQKYYAEKASSGENNHSVCTLFTQGDKNFLFTGDLEKSGETSLIALNDLPTVELFKAGHHGSVTSSNRNLLSVIQPKICCVCCCCGNVEYTQNLNNTFPSQDFINRISEYTDKVYVTTLGPIKYNSEKSKYENDGYTSLNGNIIVMCVDGEISVACSNNNTPLKDTDWFKENRAVPNAWE